MSIIVTGGAGFIGSCIIRTLNDLGMEDIIVVDNIGTTEKWMNLRNKKYLEYINRDDFLDRLPEFGGVSHVIHMGACSSTTERDFDFLNQNNLNFTKRMWEFCTKNKTSFIYASSAATYGDGSNGFDDEKDIDALMPLNAYGYSKQLFDLWAKKEINNKADLPRQYVGLKFFNVYGPNEYFKNSMASVIMHTYDTIKKTGRMGLFKSYKDGYEDGKQLRDFIYVKDICDVIVYMMHNEHINGLFNLGTGKARSFWDLATATFNAMDIEPQIDFVEMPEELREKYQYFTEASMNKLCKAGYNKEFYTLEDGCADYVKNYLMKGKLIY